MSLEVRLMHANGGNGLVASLVMRVQLRPEQKPLVQVPLKACNRLACRVVRGTWATSGLRSACMGGCGSSLQL